MKENPLSIQYTVESVFALLPNLTLSTFSSKYCDAMSEPCHMNVIGSIQVDDACASQTSVGPFYSPYYTNQRQDIIV